MECQCTVCGRLFEFPGHMPVCYSATCRFENTRRVERRRAAAQRRLRDEDALADAAQALADALQKEGGVYTTPPLTHATWD